MDADGWRMVGFLTFFVVAICIGGMDLGEMDGVPWSALGVFLALCVGVILLRRGLCPLKPVVVRRWWRPSRVATGEKDGDGGVLPTWSHRNVNTGPGRRQLHTRPG